MFPKGEVKRNLLGTLEIALFMSRGPLRFGNSFNEMLRSCLILLIDLPITYISLVYMQPTKPEIAGIPTGLVFLAFVLKIVVVFVCFLGILYLVTKQYDRKQHLLPCITALNWSGLISNVLFFPLLVSVITGAHTWTDIEPLLIMLALYAYAYVAFTLTYVLRIPWQLGGFLAICGMALNQTSLDVLYALLGSS